MENWLPADEGVGQQPEQYEEWAFQFTGSLKDLENGDVF